MKFLKVDLLKDSILKSMIIFSIPILISLLFQNLYHMADFAIVGNFLGVASLSAIGACSAIYNLLISFASGLGNGMAIVLGRSFGANDQDELKSGVAASLVIGTVVTFAFILFGLFGLRLMMVLQNTPVEIFEESFSYVFIIVMCGGITFLYNLLSAILRAVGNSVAPLVVLIISSVINVFLDVVFVAVFHMGVRGTGIATVLAQLISVISCIVYILKCEQELVPSTSHFKVVGGLYKELLGQGVSMAMMMAIVNCGSLALQSAINALGTFTISAFSTARSIMGFTIMPINAIATSLTAYISQNKGAKQYNRILDGVRIANWIVIIASLVNILVCFVLGKWIAEMVSGTTEPEVIVKATNYIRFSSCFYPVLGVLCNTRNTLQGLGKKVVPLISSIIELIAKFMFTFLIIPALGFNGVILAEPLIWCVMTIQLWSSYFKERKGLLELAAKQ